MLFALFQDVKFQPLNHQKQSWGLKIDTVGASRHVNILGNIFVIVMALSYLRSTKTTTLTQ